MNLDLEGVSWEKYRCRDCGRTFLSMGRRPRCPACRSENVSKA